jgi:hypothetical protein
MPEATQTYESEQTKLQAEYSGNSAEDIHITIPKEPEVNPEVWKDVEPLLYRGFLTVSAEINSVSFVFKSLNHHEFELLRFSGGFREGRVTEQFWWTFLAYGVFMVDGVNILVERDKWIPKLADTFGSLPKDARSKIVRYVGEVNRRASNAVALTEAYAMESLSRYRWMQIKGLDLTSTAVTGIEGTQRLGLNWSQQLWRALNHAEDRNEQHEREWENAKFVGSCFAGKGIAKVYNQDNERRRKDKEERLSRKDKILREIILGEKQEANVLKIPGAVITVPRTVEELASQLEKDLRGEKDWHDRVIEDHETKIRNQYNDRRVQVEQVARENAVQFGDRNVVGNSDAREGLTPREVADRVERRKQQAQQVHRHMDSVDQDEKAQNFLGKWGVTGPEVSTEVSTTDRDISGAVQLPAPRTPTTPFRRKT